MPTKTRFALRHNVSLLTPDDLHLFNEGSHTRLYEKLGAHIMTIEGATGTCFSVWAPNAERVSLLGNFNGWNPGSHPLDQRERSGIWEGFVAGVGKGEVYKFHIVSRNPGYQVSKADPFGVLAEVPPKTASVVWDLDYTWSDSEWMKDRDRKSTRLNSSHLI